MPYIGSVPSVPGDLSVNRYQPVGDAASYQEMATIYDRPLAEQPYQFARHLGYIPFATMLRSMGFTMGCKNPTFGHYEEPWKEDPVSVNAIITASSGAGTNVILELTAASMYDTAQTISGSGRKASYPLQWDVIMAYDGTLAQIISKNTATDPHRITIRPFNTTDDLVGKFVAGGVYANIGPAMAEASDLPGTRAPRVLKYRNQFQISKVACKGTGTEMTNAVYFELPGQAGTGGQSIYKHIERDTIMQHEMNKANTLLFGKSSNNLLATGTQTALNMDVDISTTEGFLTFAETDDTVQTYTAGTYDLTDLYRATKVIKQQRASQTGDVILWQGPDAYNEMENLLLDTTRENLNYAMGRLVDGFTEMDGYFENLTSGPSDTSFSIGYYAVKKDGFVIHFKQLDEFSNIRGAGTDNYRYQGYNLFMPVGWTKELTTGDSRPTIGYQYKQLGNYSRENVYGDFSGAGVGGDNSPHGKAVHTYDINTKFLVSEIGFHGAVANGLVVQYATA